MFKSLIVVDICGQGVFGGLFCLIDFCCLLLVCLLFRVVDDWL